MADSTGRYIDAGDGKLYAHVRESEGMTLVFLHYYGGSHRTWRPLIELGDPRRGAIVLDQRGWGESNGVPGVFSIAQLADDAQKVIETVGLDDYVVVGHSMGGKVAQLLASRRPAGLRGVVLVAPAPPRNELPAEAKEFMLHVYDTKESVGGAIDAALTANGLSDDLRQQVIEDSTRGSEAARRAWPEHSFEEDISGEVGKIEVPVLVLAGDQDEVDTPASLEGHLLPLIPTATMIVLSGTGHLSPLEVPEQLNEHLEAFLATLSRSSSKTW